MGGGTINGEFVELRMHGPVAMKDFATAAVLSDRELCSKADTKRLYWILERINNPKAVLTVSCMEGLDNPTSLRWAIDAAMRVGEG